MAADQQNSEHAKGTFGHDAHPLMIEVGRCFLANASSLYMCHSQEHC